jgi:hypothetical protein
MDVSARECKLFGGLLTYLSECQHNAFAILNSQCQIDIESMGWSAAPAEIRRKAVSAASGWRKAAIKTEEISIDGWRVKLQMVSILTPQSQTWRIVTLIPPVGDKSVSDIAREEMRPIFSWD